jgi:ribosomal protein L11 methyltransferase
MSFRELVFTVTAQEAENLGDALMEIGALSVSVLDADADTDEENPLYGEPGMVLERQAWNLSSVQALFDNSLWESNPDLSKELVSTLNESGFICPQPSEKLVADQDWVRLTQSQFDPIQIGKKLWVIPSWHDAPPQAQMPDAICLAVDPGLAFGTGSHPTTRLCMQWLEELSIQHQLKNKTLLDYGCGSGILAIAAKKLGSGKTWGVDIDPQSVTSAIDNAKINDTEISFSLPDVDDTSRLHDIVVANILANPLLVLAPALCQRLAPGGKLALSGILERQTEMVIEAYRPWLNLSVWESIDGWVCLTGQLSYEAK